MCVCMYINDHQIVVNIATTVRLVVVTWSPMKVWMSVNAAQRQDHFLLRLSYDGKPKDQISLLSSPSPRTMRTTTSVRSLPMC